MKKSLLALAVLGAFAGAASAQSSVTLSGGIDAAIQRQNDAWNFSTGNSGRTNFTLSGREDLGGGTYAFFALNYLGGLGRQLRRCPPGPHVARTAGVQRRLRPVRH
jgi:predicted porin